MNKLGFIIVNVALLSSLTAQQLTLNESVNIALQNKETLQSAKLDLQSVKASRIGAYSNILPSVNLSSGRSETSYADSDLYPNNTVWSAGLSVSQNIFDGGGWWNQITLANNNYAIQQQVERQVRINVIAEVHRAYFQLLKSQHLVEVAMQSLELAEQQVELAQRKYDLGAAKKTDLLKSEVAAGTARSSLISQEANLYAARSEFRNSLGLIGDARDLVISEEINPLEQVLDWDESIALMKVNNPGIISVERQLTSAKINRKLTNAVRLPSLNASFSYHASDSDIDGLSSALNNDWSMTTGLNLSFPLFTGMRYSTQSQQAKLAVKKQENEIKTITNDAIVLLEAYYETVKDYFKIIPIFEEIVASAEEDLKLASEQYRLGAISILELLDAQVSDTQARADLVTAKYDAKIQETYLKAQLGILDKEYENN
jgi:outer membrane protein TolC